MLNIEKVMEQSEIGFARQKIIYDETGKPVDYIFLAVNPSFEKFTGLKRKQILNRRVTEVLPKSKDDAFDWISYYGKIVTDPVESIVFTLGKDFGNPPVQYLLPLQPCELFKGWIHSKKNIIHRFSRFIVYYFLPSE